jgi:hypothetical protein
MEGSADADQLCARVPTTRQRSCSLVSEAARGDSGEQNHGRQTHETRHCRSGSRVRPTPTPCPTTRLRKRPLVLRPAPRPLPRASGNREANADAYLFSKTRAFSRKRATSLNDSYRLICSYNTIFNGAPHHIHKTRGILDGAHA